MVIWLVACLLLLEYNTHLHMHQSQLLEVKYSLDLVFSTYVYTIVMHINTRWDATKESVI